jgi:hypothetical protein
MTRARYTEVSRLARLGALGKLACTLKPSDYQTIALPIFDLRLGWRSFSKHPRWPRTFDDLRDAKRRRMIKAGKWAL